MKLVFSHEIHKQNIIPNWSSSPQWSCSLTGAFLLDCWFDLGKSPYTLLVQYTVQSDIQSDIATSIFLVKHSLTLKEPQCNCCQTFSFGWLSATHCCRSKGCKVSAKQRRYVKDTQCFRNSIIFCVF